MNRTRNIAARAGAWSARHRRRAIFGWLVFVVAAVVIGGSVGTKVIDQDELNVGEAGRADRALADANPRDKAEEMVLVQNRRSTAREPEFRGVVRQVIGRLERIRGLDEIASPYDPRHGGQISADGRSALVTFEIPGDEDVAEELVDRPLAAVAAVERRNPGWTVEEFGDASSDKAVSKSFEDDFRKAEFTSLPVTLVILVIAFGALVAALVPLVLAATAVAAAIGLIGPLSQLSPVDESITSVVLLIGLAVGVDYSMFYLRREREERARGNSERASLDAAAATSGRAVLVSGITVMIAMAGMFLAGAKTFTAFATGTILVVAIALVGSLTVLPAVLATLGDRVNKGRIPGLQPEKRTGESRFWNAILDRVLRHPSIAAAASVALLLVLASPALDIHTATPGIESLPRDLPVMRTYDRIQAAFPGSPAPAVVVVHGPNATSFESQAALRDLTAIASRTSGFKEPITIDRTQTNTAISASIPVVGNGTDAASERALAKLRDELIPQTVGRVDGVQVDVTGFTASSKDFNDLMKQRIWIVFAFVLGLAFLLLLVTFRSIVIPIKAILLNLLSVTAAYGIVTWVFQDGNLESLLGFTSTGSITSWLPLFLFVVLFGLSMDYHVFILTRIREAYDSGMPTEEAVGHGIKSTASVVTSAAVVMVAVFAIFATLSQLIFKQFGVGLAVAVLIDATIIRALLLPAAMKLLGDWNWYLPGWLEWLPRVSPERGVAPAAASGDGAPFAVPEEAGEGAEHERVGGRG
jgi:uncharacterized membrane protein YdfJ with MMPL/SSD domain